MDFDGAINAKAEVFERVFGFREMPSAQLSEAGPTFVPQEGTQAFSEIRKAREQKRHDPRDLIAVGVIGPVDQGRGAKETSLGIFLQRNRLRDHAIVERAARLIGREARIIVTGPIRRFSAMNTSRCRPLRIGASVGHHKVTAGTLGCFAKVREEPIVGLLSNNHVLAFTNGGTRGDIIIQSGKADGGDIADASTHAAELHSFVPIEFSPNAINYVDCAFACLLDGVSHISHLAGEVVNHPQHWPVKTVDELLYSGIEVKKVGRTTAFTAGLIAAVAVDNLHVAYRFGARNGTARFDQQISIAGAKGHFSKPGDSGSLIFSKDDRPVALLFAGSDTGGANGGGITFANPIQAVLDALSLDIYAADSRGVHGSLKG